MDRLRAALPDAARWRKCSTVVWASNAPFTFLHFAAATGPSACDASAPSVE